MNNLSQALWVFGSSIILLLGTIHLIYTLYTKKLNPRRGKLIQVMKGSFPILTPKTTMWNAWIGFNCSHSSGAMFFGLINMYLSIAHFHLITSDIIIIMLDLMMCFYYCWLGWKYWFRIPLIGIVSMTTCYALATLLSIINLEL